MTYWPEIIRFHEENSAPSVLVTVGTVRGSTPRETGACMLVTDTTIIGTIGGGSLEHLAIEKARHLFKNNSSKTQILSLPLGPELAQCCGGHADILLCHLTEEDTDWITSVKNALTFPAPTLLLSDWKDGTVSRSVITDPQNLANIDKSLLTEIKSSLENRTASIYATDQDNDNFTLIEPINSPLFHLTLFGAGHVGKAVVQTLSQLPCTITWIDERAEMFPEHIPSNVQKIHTSHPRHYVEAAPANDFYLVMTHSHQLDLEICADILKRKDSIYLGLIGSQTKMRKFDKRLRLRGFQSQEINRITCPIGLHGLQGKHPAQIAISVSAEILYQLQSSKQITAEQEKSDYSLLKM